MITTRKKTLPVRAALLSCIVSSIIGLSGASAQPNEPTDPASIGTLRPNGIRHVNVSQSHDLISADPSIIIVDVRSGMEFQRGHIDGAININYLLPRFRNHLSGLDPDKTYLVHCKSGHRSGRAAPIMKAEGFSNVIHMDGGFDAWKKAGLPIESK